VTTYAEVLAELELRWEPRTVPDLTRITAVLDLLGSPHRAYPAVHVTGTNGKTSTARMVESLLRSFGLRTGRYTSPHLEDVRERISVDGEPLSPEAFAAAYDDVAATVALVDRDALAAGGETVSYFELLTAMAFASFADAPVDVAVVEVGLEGRWDATNVLDAQVCVVTPVSLDHTALLGDDVASIAAETAGIVSAGAVTVLAPQPPDAAQVLLRHCVEVGATVAREGVEFGILSREVAVGGQRLVLQGRGGIYDDLFLPLHGVHQAHNAACALAAVEAFLGAGQGAEGQGAEGQRGRLDAEAVREGFAAATSPGRLEVVRSGPTVLLDGAHNPAGAEALVAAIGEAFAFERLVGVVGVLADKDAAVMLATLEPILAQVVCTSSTSPRALPADELARAAVDVFGADRVEAVPGIAAALEVAVQLVEDDDELIGSTGGGVLVTGSLITVGEARALLAPHPR
jgi:dihydrofolate synthase/folylpolyglutamate synthase